MSLVALLIAREPADDAPLRALVRFGALSLIEYQARQALDLGASRIVIHTRSADPALPQLVDRLTARGRAEAMLVRDMPALARHIDPDDEVLLIADGLVAPQGALAALAGAGPAHLLVVPMVEATVRFERIDPRHGWAGAARLRGRILLDTLDMLGEWDLLSTLVRAAVQQSARRVELSPELATQGRLAVLTSQPLADVAFQALGDADEETANERHWLGLDEWLGGRFGPALATAALRRQFRATHFFHAGLLLGGIALVPAWLGWLVLAVLLALAGLGLRGIARAVRALSRDDPAQRWLEQGQILSVLALLGIVAWRQWAGPTGVAWAAVLAPPLLCALAWLAAGLEPARALPAWLWPMPASVLFLLLIGLVLGVGGIALLAIMALCAAAVGLVLLRAREVAAGGRGRAV